MNYTLTFTKRDTTDPVRIYEITADNLDQAYLNGLAWLLSPNPPEVVKTTLDKCILKVAEAQEITYPIAAVSLAQEFGYLIAVFEDAVEY